MCGCNKNGSRGINTNVPRPNPSQRFRLPSIKKPSTKTGRIIDKVNRGRKRR